MVDFNLVKGFLTSPSKTFKKVQSASLGDAFKYFLTLGILFAILMGIVMSFMPANPLLGSLGGVGPFGILVSIIGLYILMAVGSLISGAILHIFAFIFGARKGITQTIKAVLYGSTPSLLLGWIPILNILIAIWSLVLEIIGLKNLHNISTGRAVAAVLLPIIIVVVLVMTVLAFLFAALFGGLAGGLPGGIDPGAFGNFDPPRHR